VRSARWDQALACWAIITDAGEELDFDVVVPCLGMLSDPRMLDVPGLTSFDGPAFHTSRYEHRHDLADKRVAVVGTGSTACQLVPALATDVAHLDVYQHEPGHLLPKHVRVFSDEERRRFREEPWRQRVERFRLFYGARSMREALRTGTPLSLKSQAVSERFITKTVHDAELRSLLTPGYAFGCKRPVFASGFYAALNRDNVRLVPRAVAALVPDGIVDADGVRRPADVVIFATGFKATEYLRTLEVYGLRGLSLQEVWAGEPTAFLGMTVPDFPNFFIVYGPNTNGGWSVITQLERQAELIARLVRELRGRRVDIIDTHPRAARRYDAWVQQEITRKLSALSAGCANYYHSMSGRNVTQWPLSHTEYMLVTRVGQRWGLIRRRSTLTVDAVEPTVPRAVPVGAVATAEEALLDTGVGGGRNG
jgi:cation diffusion facilitator CzcD-associated flavoprotein CzcO